MLIDLVRIGLKSRAFAPPMKPVTFRSGLLAAGITRTSRSLYAGHPVRSKDSATILQIFDGDFLIRTGKAQQRISTGETILVTPSRPLDLGLFKSRTWTAFYLCVTGNDAMHLANLITVACGLNFTIGQEAIDTLAAYCRDALTRPNIGAGANAALAYGAMATLADAALLPALGAETDQPEWLEKVLDAILSNLSEPLRVDVLASLANLSRAHFVRAFTKAMRCPPTEFIIRRRMDHACHLLIETELSITEIARRTGFRDAGYLSKTLSRLTGMNPTRFRGSRAFENALAAPAREAPLPLTIAEGEKTSQRRNSKT